MATNKKSVVKKPVKKAAPAKVVKPVEKKAAAKKAVAPKKTTEKPVAVKKAMPKKVVEKPVAKKKVAAPIKKTAPTKKVAEKQPVKKIEKPVQVKKAAVPIQKTTSEKIAPKEATVKKTESNKLSKKNIKEESVAIKKPEKKKEQPVKEVKIPKTTVKTSKPYRPDYKPLEERNNNDNNDSMPIVRYSDAELEEFREIINKKLADATQEVNYLQGIITRKDDMGGDSEGRYMTMEDGTVSMEREQMSQMVSRQISFIDNLKKALIRIENKTYGICRVTGKLIEKARLKAVPHATLSLEAKMGMARSKEQ